MEFRTLVSEYFNWNTKPITHHIYKWIGNYFIIAFGQWLQLLILQEMFDHHKNVSIMLYY
jgi:hypothetical protein